MSGAASHSTMIAPGPETGRDLWLRRVEQTPARPFLACAGRSWTFGEFDEEVRRLAAGFARIGVGVGTRVVILLGNRPEAVRVQLALHQLGAVCVPLLASLTPAELAYPIEHSEATLLVADASAAALLADAHERLRRLARVVVTADVDPPPAIAVTLLEDLAAGAPTPSARLEGYGADALAAILYTSGSTGRPKGVMIRAGSFFSVGEAFAERFGIGEDDVYLLPTPYGHAVGAVTALSTTLHTGGRLALVDRFSPARFWDDVAATGATYSILFPAHLNLLLEADDGRPAAGETSLRLVITHAFIDRFSDRFGVALATVWGMTETGALSVGSRPGERAGRSANYVGTPMRGVEVALFDDELARRGPGEPGEIALRHPHVMLGYLKDPEATAASLVDGWVRSGDQGVLDAEGRLFFVGRIKNVIKRSGENVSAEEVETALADHPDVAECTVFAVPDNIRTEEVAAVVVRRTGAAAAPAALRAACADRLARFKLPRYLLLRDAPLPRLPNGKLDRVALRSSVDLADAWDAEAEGAR